jgi:pimeloyl-ACP methyl ester carboxylesterase
MAGPLPRPQTPPRAAKTPTLGLERFHGTHQQQPDDRPDASYWEGARAATLVADYTPPEVSFPMGFTQFPCEIFRAPRSWVQTVYANLIYFNKVDEGGHFAAWEEPDLFAAEMRAAFRSLR